MVKVRNQHVKLSLWPHIAFSGFLVSIDTTLHLLSTKHDSRSFFYSLLEYWIKILVLD